MDYFFQNSKVK